jgi:hypothetical protein
MTDNNDVVDPLDSELVSLDPVERENENPYEDEVRADLDLDGTDD